ncbi:heparan sulfate 2-O-sulfotransferase 1 isoform X1 [Chrysemys picta bellii]|uniref:heparan sulfate 2-O-sulfotransferase 1 isoform X1 n=1 Tax=Chrysemys picta bellii TaxID=8478 RepID=UPI0032B26D2F
MILNPGRAIIIEDCLFYFLSLLFLDTRNSLDTLNANVRSTLGVGENEKEEERKECLKRRGEEKIRQNAGKAYGQDLLSQRRAPVLRGRVGRTDTDHHACGNGAVRSERAIARHEVREIEQRHTIDGPRQDATLDEDDDVVIIYNRVPKTASTSFTNIAYDLCAKNKYHVLHINTTKNNPVMSLQDQVRFVKNVTSWKEMKPGFYHGHISYLDFAKFGVKKKPIYINVIRDPIERLVSYYYFLRFGDDYRPGLRRRKQGDKKTFDECVAAGGSDCAPEKLWLQIPFFCGHSSECWNVGSRWALEQAKYNLINEFFLVGVTEELEDFIMLLEATLPRFFRGATELYRTGKKSHLRKTTEKKLPTKETIAKLQQSEIWKMENEFYEFALEQFQFVRAHAVREKDGELYILTQNFFYEKIYPKSN